MKALLLSHSDGRGGAFAAAYRLHCGFRQIGLESRFMVSEKTREDRSVVGPQTKIKRGLARIRPYLDSLPVKFYSKRQHAVFSTAFLPESLPSRVLALHPDIVHLHWVTGGFMQIESLMRINKPIIWTLHDMWPFTGGCHYSADCTRYLSVCGDCPILNSGKEHDLSRWIWNRKRKAWNELNITFVAPSRWLADCAKSSALGQPHRVEIIPNGLDMDRFKPVEKSTARELLSLPQGKTLILFGGTFGTNDRRKGFRFLVAALKKLSKKHFVPQIELVVFGAYEPENPRDLGFKVHYMGSLHDEVSLSLMYSAADVLIAPSIQDNLPNTVMESMACGTPCVAFNVGGMPDMIEHKKNGYLASAFNENELADGMSWVLENNERRSLLSQGARQRAVKDYALERIARRYADLYCRIA
jgi:glycosyltransferase involved in cell wall biosynthesis